MSYVINEYVVNKRPPSICIIELLFKRDTVEVSNLLSKRKKNFNFKGWWNVLILNWTWKYSVINVCIIIASNPGILFVPFKTNDDSVID